MFLFRDNNGLLYVSFAIHNIINNFYAKKLRLLLNLKTLKYNELD